MVTRIPTELISNWAPELPLCSRTRPQKTMACPTNLFNTLHMPAVVITLVPDANHFPLLSGTQRNHCSRTLDLIEGLLEFLKELARLKQHAHIRIRASPPRPADCDDGRWRPASGHQRKIRHAALCDYITSRTGLTNGSNSYAGLALNHMRILKPLIRLIHFRILSLINP